MLVKDVKGVVSTEADYRWKGPLRELLNYPLLYHFFQRACYPLVIVEVSDSQAVPEV